MKMDYTHLVPYSGKIIETTVTDKASMADDWVRDIRSMYKGWGMIIGMDCKRRPHPIRSLSNKIATLQLCIGSKCLILQLLYIDYIPRSIKCLLSDPNIIFVGVEAKEVVLKLGLEYELYFCPDTMMDVGTLAAKKCYMPWYREKTSLKALAYQLVDLHKRKPKRGCEINWESRVLDEEHIEYACVDAYASYKIGHKLLTGYLH